jgi:triosephosphate isomerase
MQWFPVLLVAIFALFVQLHCLRHEPWHDFRPWKVGNFIAGETYSKSPEIDFVFQYKNNADGSIREITMDELSNIAEDSLQSNDLEMNYTYYDRIEKIITPGINARLADFSITDLEQKQDIKNNVIISPSYTFIIFIRDVTEVTSARFTSTKNLIEELEANSMDYYVITGSLPEETVLFNTENQVDIHFYFSDITPLKTAIRNNPGVILLKEGYVIDKWSFRDIPSMENIKESMSGYEKKLEKYKLKHPPVLPAGETQQPLKKERLENNKEISVN